MHAEFFGDLIPISCRTNIDCAKRLEWPISLPASPQVGDLIRSLSSTNKKHIELQVVQVTWVGSGSKAYLQVELHLPPHRYENLQVFEKFVKEPR